MMKRIVLILIGLVCITKTFSQDFKEDSLLVEFEKATQDTVKINILIRLFEVTERSDTKKSYDYARQALELSQKCNYKIGIGRSLMFLGDNKYREGENDSSTYFYNKSLTIFKNISSKKYISLCYNRLGQIAMKNGDFDKALEYYLISLETIEGLSEIGLFADIYLQIGNLYFYKGDYAETLKNYQLSLSLSEEINDESAISACLTNIGSVNANFGNYAKALNFYQEASKKFKKLNDKLGEADCINNIGLVNFYLNKYELALQYYQSSLQMYKELNYKIGLINSYNNIGQVYTDQKKYEEARMSFENALKLSEQNNDKYNILISYINLGFNELNAENFKKAKAYFNRSLEISTELNDAHSTLICYENLAQIQIKVNNPLKAIELISKSISMAKEIGVKRSERDAYLVMSKAYELLNNHKKALKYFKLHKTMYDSIFNEESSEQINIMETVYQTEKKQQQIELQETKLVQQEAEIEQQKILRNTLVGGLVAVLVIAILAGYAYNQKRKSNKKIAAQRDEIEGQKEIIEKKNIHITDSINYARRIQESVFLSGNEMKQHFQDSFLLNQPKDIVSGDFFWFTEMDNKKIFAVVDCTGHGVPGAFMSLIGNSLLNEIVKEKRILEPSEILNALHLGVICVLRQDTEHTKSNDGMDMVICVYDDDKKQLHFSGARNFMYIKNGRELEILNGDPFSIGEIPFRKDMEVKFRTQSIKINGETKIYLMTDGYMDQFGGPKLKKFNQLPFEEMLQEISNLPMAEQKEKMYQTFTNWKGSCKQIDDVMILGISLS